MRSDRVRWPFAILTGMLLLLWPAVINRAPLLFVDTTAYVRAADAAVVTTRDLQPLGPMSWRRGKRPLLRQEQIPT
jgi:hypothetical protein